MCALSGIEGTRSVREVNSVICLPTKQRHAAVQNPIRDSSRNTNNGIHIAEAAGTMHGCIVRK